MSTSARKNASKNTSIIKQNNNVGKKVVVEENQNSSTIQPEKISRKTRVNLPLNTEVKVINGTYGELIYISKKNMGYELSWDGFGAENLMELEELIAARNSDKRFFTENWWIFEDDDVVEFLGVGQYYQNSIKIDDFESIFTESAEDIEQKVSVMSDGLKRTIAARAYELIAEDKIYDIRIIKALEKSTGFELTEK